MPLHTSAISILATVEIVAGRVNRNPGPIGTLTRRIISPFIPIAILNFIIRSTVLTLVSLIDTSILPLTASILSTFIPSSAGALEKFATQVERTAENLPGKIEEGIEIVESFSRNVPVIAWIVWWLTSSGAELKEEEKVVDVVLGEKSEEEIKMESENLSAAVKVEKMVVTEEIPILDLFDDWWCDLSRKKNI